MGLKPCRECGGQVSTEAAACPHCGAPAPIGAAGQVERAHRMAEKVERGQVDAMRAHRQKRALASTVAILGLAIGFASCAAGASSGVWLFFLIGSLVAYGVILLT